MLNKIFIQVDEARSLFDRTDKLKNAITNSTMTFERKGQDGETIENRANFYFSSNNEKIFNISSDDRRMCLFQCSSKYKGNTEYFNALLTHLQTPGVNLAFHTFLKNFPLPPAHELHFQLLRPKTEFYKESQKGCIPPESRFLSAIVNFWEGTVLDFQAAQLYERYRHWIQMEGYQFSRQNNQFGIIIKKYHGVSEGVRRGNHRTYMVDTKELLEALQDKNEHDVDAILHPFAPHSDRHVPGSFAQPH